MLGVAEALIQGKKLSKPPRNAHLAIGLAEFLVRIKNVGWVAQRNHRYYRDRVPSYEKFLDAAAESWIETKRRFEEETRCLGFVPIDPEMKASALNKMSLALLSAHGSAFLLGPGAFERSNPDAPGAVLSYVKIPLREHEGLLENTDQERGAFLVSKPGIGKLVEKREFILPLEETDRKVLFLPLLHLLLSQCVERPNEKEFFRSLQLQSQALPEYSKKFTKRQGLPL